MDSFLRPVSPGTLIFVAAVAEWKMPMVLQQLSKLTEGEKHNRNLTPISELEAQALSATGKIHHRFMLGDYRMNSMELGQVFESANVLVRLSAEMQGTSPRYPAQSYDGAFQDELAPNQSYGEAIAMVRSGALSQLVQA